MRVVKLFKQEYDATVVGILIGEETLVLDSLVRFCIVLVRFLALEGSGHLWIWCLNINVKALGQVIFYYFNNRPT